MKYMRAKTGFKYFAAAIFLALIILFFPFESIAQTVIRAEDFAGEYTGARHSMRDPSGYAAVKTLEAVAAKAGCGEYEKIYIIEGGEDAARNFFEISGAAAVKKVESQNSRGEKWDYFECSIGGEKAACEYHVFGEDMLRHIMLCYSFRNIDARRIKGILRNGSFDKIYIDFYKSLKIAGTADYGIIGYRRAVVRHIYWRVNAHRKAAAVKEFMAAAGGSEKASDGLKAEIIKSAGMRFYFENADLVGRISEFFRLIEKESDLKKYFLNSPDFYEFDDIDKTASGLYKKSPPALKTAGRFAALLDENGFKFKTLEGKAGEFFNDIPFDVRRVTFKDGEGRIRSLLACEHPYGGSAMAMASAMGRRGMKKIIFYGTCGSFVTIPKYSVIIPSAIIGPDGRAYGNAIYDDHKAAAWRETGMSAHPDGAAVVLTGKHASIFSPLAETRRVINEFTENGVDSVDCEAAHVFAAPACSNAERSAVFIASDFPGTDSTIESWERENESYIRAQMKILDMIIKELDIAEIILK